MVEKLKQFQDCIEQFTVLLIVFVLIVQVVFIGFLFYEVRESLHEARQFKCMETRLLPLEKPGDKRIQLGYIARHQRAL